MTRPVFRVIEAYDHPHGGRILRLRLGQGEAPSLKELKGGTLVARGPKGEELPLVVAGFAVFGGRPSDARLARTGRVDVHIQGENPSSDLEASGDGAAAVEAGWELSGPV